MSQIAITPYQLATGKPQKFSRSHTEVVLVLPPMAHLEVVVVDNQPHKPLEEMLTLSVRKTVDALDMVAESKYTFPAGDWVSPDNWMGGSELSPNIFRSAAWTLVKLKTVFFGASNEPGLSIGGSQSIKKLLVRLRYPIINFISGCPEGIYK